MTGRILLTIALLGLTATTGMGQSSSLYKKAAATPATVAGAVGEPEAPATRAPSLIAAPKPKPKKFAKQDLITIIVREQTSHTASGSVTTERDGSIDGGIDSWARLKLGSMPAEAVNVGSPAPEIKADIKREFDGSGTAARTDSITARITGRIIDIKPNGNLVIEASEKITTDEEAYTMTLTGVCRTTDVTADNSILSSQVAELEINKTSSGAIKDATKRSLLHKLLDWVNLL